MPQLADDPATASVLARSNICGAQVYNAIDTGTRVDEINQPKSDVRFTLK
jgi:hypothetical protein